MYCLVFCKEMTQRGQKKEREMDALRLENTKIKSDIDYLKITKMKIETDLHEEIREDLKDAKDGRDGLQMLLTDVKGNNSALKKQLACERLNKLQQETLVENNSEDDEYESADDTGINKSLDEGTILIREFPTSIIHETTPKRSTPPSKEESLLSPVRLTYQSETAVSVDNITNYENLDENESKNNNSNFVPSVRMHNLHVIHGSGYHNVATGLNVYVLNLLYLLWVTAVSTQVPQY